MENLIAEERNLWSVLLDGFSGKTLDLSKGNITLKILILSVPMILEMLMESVFSLADVFFVGKLGVNAVATIGLTESVMSVLYSVAIGMSMAATALIARRIGEKKPEKASLVVTQALGLTVLISLGTGLLGYFYAEELLKLMGASGEVIRNGLTFTRLIFAGNISVLLLFVINGIFHGAGNAAIAMQSLWVGNLINIVLDPILIFGFGSIPAFGLEGAAYATLIGRSAGVIYQLIILVRGKTALVMTRECLVVKFKVIKKLLKLSLGSMSQFVIEALSWILLIKIISGYGDAVVAGYTIAYRILIFSILPGWGMANAAATMVGQNLGAGKKSRAEESVWKTIKLNSFLLGLLSVVFLLFPDFFISLFSSQTAVMAQGKTALQFFSIGFIFFAWGMVLSQSMNGAGDTKTPAIINILVFVCIQIPLAYVLAEVFDLHAMGVYLAIAVSYLIHAGFSLLAFKKGNWKLAQV